ncbi:MAG: hypothetical protein ACKVOK_13905 [Flavobacteriales bacterium]
MSDERFYDQVRNTMSGYAPEVPQAAYGKMRRALWWSNFTKLSVTRFNMWYLIALLGIGGGAAAMFSNGETPLQPAAMAPVIQMETPVLPALNASANPVQTQTSCTPSACCQSNSGSSCGTANNTSNAGSNNNLEANPSAIPPVEVNPYTETTGPNDGEAHSGTPEEVADESITTSDVTEEVAVTPKKELRTKGYKVKTLEDSSAKKKPGKKK